MIEPRVAGSNGEESLPTAPCGESCRRESGEIALPEGENPLLKAQDGSLDVSSSSGSSSEPVRTKNAKHHVALLTGGFDRPYAFGLCTALASSGINLDVIGSDEVDVPEMHSTPGIRFLNLHRTWALRGGLFCKIKTVVAFYLRLASYVPKARPKVFHILWNNKVPIFDRTLLLLYYKAFGKKLVFTAHNVNAGTRDGNDSVLNRWTLRIQYYLVDHIFVHTTQMATDLVQDFCVESSKITVIPFGINNSVPTTRLTSAEARLQLGISQNDKVILFFGNIRPYKGLEYLIDALALLNTQSDHKHRLVVAGQPNPDCYAYWMMVQEKITAAGLDDLVTCVTKYIPDKDTELYFKAADVSALPYAHVYQSGVLFLGYNFGTPAIAADVGSFRQDIEEMRTGLICKPRDPSDLARAIERYFQSDLYRFLNVNRVTIRKHFHSRNSWRIVAEKTERIYTKLRFSS